MNGLSLEGMACCTLVKESFIADPPTHLNITSIQSAVLSSAAKTCMKFSESELISLCIDTVSLMSSEVFVFNAESIDVIKFENPFFIEMRPAHTQHTTYESNRLNWNEC